MKDSPLVSIIVTVFNKAGHVEQTLRSAIDQTYPNLEVIVIDDGSTDDSPGIVNALAARHTRLHAIHQTNAGVAQARNRGLAEAVGSFVNILDGDDLLYPGFVEQTVARLRENPALDVVHTSWDRIDESGNRIATNAAPHSDDYLHDLLLGNLFAPSALMMTKQIVDRTGPVRDGLAPTEHWEYVIRLAKLGAVFVPLDDVLVGCREVPPSARKVQHTQQNRFFPVIDLVFDGTMGPEYERLKNLSIVRHRFFLMGDYLKWGLKHQARQQFELGLDMIRNNSTLEPQQVRYFREFLPALSLSQTLRFTRALSRQGLTRQAAKAWLWRSRDGRVGRALCPPLKQGLVALYGAARTSLARTDTRFASVLSQHRRNGAALAQGLTVRDIRRMTLDYAASMRLEQNGRFIGYRHSAATRKPVLYATIAALLLKHLYSERDDRIDRELDLLRGFQSDDGLFRDPVIECPLADSEDWWGWRHLTLHALMTLALYDSPAKREISYLASRFGNKDRFREYLDLRDFGSRAAWTSNQLQNFGVMLQYAHDFQNSTDAAQWIDVLFDVIDAKQDPHTGLYGHRFDSPADLSNGVQAGYHFWLLAFYDQRPIPHLEPIIDRLLKTQNTLGGFGVQWNSSACEDIDSIDPLARFTRLTNHRADDIQSALKRAIPAILNNLNPDGGWVFRRHEPLTVVHKQMHSAANQSNLFYTWFRTLGLAYCLNALTDPPQELRYDWNFARAPGHQFP